jgi:hypothetical protein
VFNEYEERTFEIAVSFSLLKPIIMSSKDLYKSTSGHAITIYSFGGRLELLLYK